MYDAFGRLRTIKNQSGVLVEEFTYNALGHRIGWHCDVDADGTVESNADDPWFYFAYDEGWRMVGTFRDSDTNAKEVFVSHMAGANGRGGSSALDAVILRDKDANSAGGWGSATDGTREERAYYCQNWRGDVVTMLKATGSTNCSVMESVRYSSYGVPFGITPGDVDADGDVDTDDNTNWPGSYEVRCDYDLDGDMDLNDENVTIANSGRSLGRGVLSHSSVANRRGYAGYEHDGVIDTLAHVRNRVLMTELGRWSRRDPLGYVDGMSVYAYVTSSPLQLIDPHGQVRRRHQPTAFAEVQPIDEGGGGDRCTDDQLLACPRPDGAPCMTGACFTEASTAPMIPGHPETCQQQCGDPSQLGFAYCNENGSQGECCICRPNIRRSFPNSFSCVTPCIVQHETIHTGQNCSQTVFDRECAAHSDSVDCLGMQLGNCMTDECRMEVNTARSYSQCITSRVCGGPGSGTAYQGVACECRRANGLTLPPGCDAP